MWLGEGLMQATERDKLTQSQLAREAQLQGLQTGEAISYKIQVFLK
jgi:hypothetical protein